MTSFAAPAGAASVQPQIPQFAAAQSAATWVAGQQAADGSIGGSLSTTVNAILALAAAHVDTAAAPGGVDLHGGQRQHLHHRVDQKPTVRASSPT